MFSSVFQSIITPKILLETITPLFEVIMCCLCHGSMFDLFYNIINYTSLFNLL